jgi:Rod binding domain-containing protein
MEITSTQNIPLYNSIAQFDNKADSLIHHKTNHTDSEENVTALAGKFESILWKKFLDEATKPLFKTPFSDDSTRASIYRDMMNHTIATQLASENNGKAGIAHAMSTQLFTDMKQRAQEISNNPQTPGGKI